MKKLILLVLAVASLPSCAWAQGVRIDPFPASTIAGSPLPGNAYPAMLAIPGALVTVCNYPANGNPCTNFATTYTDGSLATACPNSAQVTLQNSSTCQNAADTAGNFGFWVSAGGNYTYNITLPGSGQTYGPYAFTAATAGCPITGCTFTGAIAAPKVNNIINLFGISGADICVKIQNALAALPAQGGIVDATGITGTVQCSVNPFANMASFSSTFHPTVKFGNVDIQTSVPWVALSTIDLIGDNSNANHTRVDYIGGTTAPAVMTIGQFATLDNAHSIFGARINNVLFTSSTGMATDGLLIQATHHSEFSNDSAWGMTNCGIETKWGVTDTFMRPRVSQLDAASSGYWPPFTFPSYDFCFGGSSGFHTTDGTVIDMAAEGSTVAGVLLSLADNMVFTSGTAEGNTGVGIEMGAAGSYNMFFAQDMEANTGGDILDNGTSNMVYDPTSFDSIVYGSTCAGAILLGGTHGNPTYGGACPAQIEQYYTFDPNTTFAKELLKNIPAFLTNPQPQTGNMIGSVVFGPSATIVHPAVMLAGQPWRLLMIGTWENSQDLTTALMPALYTEVTSASPTLSVGRVSITFSLNSSNQIQAICAGCGGGRIQFNGFLIPAGTGVMTDVSNDMSLPGSFSAGSVNGALILSGTTATITGTALSATCDSGTATVAGAIVGHPVIVSSTAGADVGGAFYLRASVTATNTVTVYVCGTGTPASLAYHVTVF